MNSNWFFTFIVLIAIGFSSNSSFSQTVGADCATAPLLNVNTEYTALTNITDNIVNDPTEAACNTQTIARDGWIKFVALGTEAIVRATSTNRNPILFGYSGACGSLTNLGCVNVITTITGHTETLTLTGLISGNTYYVRIGNSTTNNMTLSSFFILTNDKCANGIRLTSNTSCVNSTGSTLGATLDSGAGVCTTGTANAVWYEFQAVVTTHVVTVDGNVGFDPVVNVISSCGSATIPSGGGCIDATNDGGIETLTLTGLTVGAFYKIQVHDYQGDFTANSFTICITHVLPICSNPIAQPTTLNLTTLSATSISGAFTAATPAPSGYLIVRSSSATPPTLVNGTTYAVASTALTPGTTYVVQGSAVTSNAVTFTDTGLTSNTRYYYHIFSYNNVCIGAPFYNTTTPLTNNAVTCPLAPTVAVNSAITGAGFTVSWTASVVGGSAGTINYTLEVYTNPAFTGPVAGSPFSVGTSITYAVTGLNAATNYYYRIKANNGVCDSTYLTGSAVTGCTTPTAQPTTLNLTTISATSISGAFTAASPAPSGYLIVRSSSATPPTLVNGTTYAVASTALTPGTTYVVQGSAVTSNAVTFTDIGLTSNTRYYYHIFSYNNSCTGAPFYNTTTPLTNNAVTCAAPPTFAVNSAITSSGFTVSWTASVVGGSAGTINYTLEVYTNPAFTGPVAGSPFSVGTPVTYAVAGLNAGTNYYYRIKANNGTCDSTYLTGSVLTGCAAPTAQPTTLNLTTVSATSISGAFTAASPAPSGYLIVRSTSATPPTLVNGTTYAVASTALTPGTTYVVQGSAVTSNAVTFTDTGLSGNTKYYYHIFSYNNSCTGAPFYNTTTPLTNNTNTCPNIPNSLTVSGVTSNAFNFNWAVPTGGTAIALTYTVQITTDIGFTVNIAGSPFTINSPTVTLSVTGLNPATTYYVRIRANNGTCSSAYVSGLTITKPINDECSTATPLTVNTHCSYTNSSNNGATNSIGVTAPGCANYIGGDVWFSAVVPANGVLIISSQAGVMLDGGMAAYSGTCGGILTLIGCDDDSAFEAMPSLTLTSLTPGNTVWIRFWEYGNDNNGTFGICVTTPCDSGTATGTTTLLCTTPIAGGLGLSGADPSTVTCVTSSCVDLEAVYPVLKSTSNYDVAAIPYAPPYQFNCLRNPVSVNVDDVWSPVITLPFNFCFYGNSYSQCVMGSNGVISFNTTLASLGSGYQYNNNLPSTTGALFANSIYGVYHDIDPSVGGEVGWELITLNTGCRALVAGWSNVPMFLDKSILYTGMMVLYENSNVIEVYIKEKKIDRYSSTFGDAWNYGNGIVGIQNAAATAAVVAPGRNGLDPNWTATNEAWRFTPSGANIATIKWFQGAGTAGTVIGTTPTINVCPTATTTYTAEISYALCNGTTIRDTDQTVVTINKDKTWNGSVDADWDKDNNWTPIGKPTAVNCIIIPDVTTDPIISSGSYNAFGHNITILNGGFLQINPTSNVTITDAVSVNTGGLFRLKNSSSLIQINNTAINSGNITMDRLTNIRKTDYVYWSSPVENFSTSAISPGTSSNYIYKWNPSIANSNNGQGNWVSGNETMIAGKGYIVRGPDSFTSTLANYTATFTGKALNGIIAPSITRGDITSVIGVFPATPYIGTNGVIITERNDNWNLIGNPYPSAISALNFLSLNAVTNNRIVGNVRLWTHGTEVSPVNANSFYATYGYNYSVTDYINYNGTGPAIPGFDGLIGAGQGFFVLMNEAPTPQTSTVTFQNSMRSNTYRNEQFYRQENLTESPNDLNTINRNRIWLSLVNSSNIANTTLVGYVDGATLGEDILFDAPHFVNTASSIYSLTEDKTWIIQGRPTPFDPNDIVPIGVVIPNNNIYNIALSKIDGLFDNTAQGIYLEDTSLGIIHDLRVSPYSFTAVTGVYNSRFKLRYTTVTLGIDNSDTNQTFAFINNNQLHIQSNDAIKEITIYDLTGKLIKTYQPTELKNNFETDFNFANGAYIAKIKLENENVVSRKLLH